MLQKLIGLVVVLASLVPIWLDSDGTAALLLVPIGLYMLFTKKDILY